MGWEVPAVSSALCDKATQCVISVSQAHSFSSACCEAHAFPLGELGLPEQKGKVAGTLRDAKGRSLLPVLGSAEVMDLVGRGRMLCLLHAVISFVSTNLLSVVMCKPR